MEVEEKEVLDTIEVRHQLVCFKLADEEYAVNMISETFFEQVYEDEC